MRVAWTGMAQARSDSGNTLWRLKRIKKKGVRNKEEWRLITIMGNETQGTNIVIEKTVSCFSSVGPWIPWLMKFIVQVTWNDSVEMTWRIPRITDTNNVRNILFPVSSLSLTFYGLHCLEQLIHMAGSFKFTALQYCDQGRKKYHSSAPIWNIQGRTLSSHMTMPRPFTINHCESLSSSPWSMCTPYPSPKAPTSYEHAFSRRIEWERGRQNIKYSLSET